MTDHADSSKARQRTSDTVRMAIDLLKLIPTRGKVTDREIHERLTAMGYTRERRSIERQLDDLSTLGFESDGAKPRGWRWRPDAQPLTLPGLNAHQSLLMQLAAQHLKKLLPAPVLKTMQQYFDRAWANLKHDDPRAVREAAWLGKVMVVGTTQQLLPPKLEPAVLESVSEALYLDRWLEVDYRNARGHASRHRVMPLGLAQQGERLFLVCRFDGYTDIRHLALHRLRAATVTTMSFEPPADWNFAAYAEGARFGFGDGTRIRLKLRIRKPEGQHLLETRLSADQTHVEIGDEYEVSATVVDSEQLRWWLMHFGAAAEVIEPPALRADLAQRLTAAAARYRSSATPGLAAEGGATAA